MTRICSHNLCPFASLYHRWVLVGEQMALKDMVATVDVTGLHMFVSPPPFIPYPPDYCMCWLMDMKVVLFNAYIYQAGPNAKIAKKGFCFLFIIIKHFVETQNAFNWSSPTKMS